MADRKLRVWQMTFFFFRNCILAFKCQFNDKDVIFFRKLVASFISEQIT